MARTDHLVRCITADGCITAMAVDSTETVQTAQMQTMPYVLKMLLTEHGSFL